MIKQKLWQIKVSGCRHAASSKIIESQPSEESEEHDSESKREDEAESKA